MNCFHSATYIVVVNKTLIKKNNKKIRSILSVIYFSLLLWSLGKKLIGSLIAKFMGPTWGPSGADRTQVGPMLAPWNLLSRLLIKINNDVQCQWLVIPLCNERYVYLHKLCEYCSDSHYWDYKKKYPNLCQVNASHRLVGAKPLSQPMLEYCLLDPQGKTSVKF